MARVRVHSFSMSLDGYVAGPDQSVENPLGQGAMRLHEWVFKTRFFQEMVGGDGGEAGLDDDYARQRVDGVGASIMGRNMFGPVRGPWGDEDWRGWWGPNPPFHHPVFVLTHHARPPIEMEGGTTFHFTDEAIEAVLERARDAAGGKDVLIGGGAATVRQYLQAGLIDEIHLAVVPVLLGSGERLFDDIGVDADDYRCVEHASSDEVTHVRLAKVTA
jgi:dihydrofolate reductase